MNMQTIQIMILLLDGFIKLAPWRTVTETMDRIGYAASESLVRSLGVALAACTRFLSVPDGLHLRTPASDRLFRWCGSICAQLRANVQPYPVRVLRRYGAVGRSVVARQGRTHRCGGRGTVTSLMMMKRNVHA
jgi:hypothetical protein